MSQERSQSLQNVSGKYFQIVSSLLKTRGILETVKYAKKMRLIVTRYISGDKLGRLDGVKVKDCWPVKINFLKHLTSTAEDIRFLLTLLTALRDVELPPVVDTSPITDKWCGELPLITVSEHRAICRELGISSRRKSEWKEFHMSTKKGPQGQAMITSIYDLFALPSGLYESISLVGGSPLKSKMDAIKAWSQDSLSHKDIWKTLHPLKRETGLLRRISYFSDKEGKTRVIALLDYWTQTALRPLHDTLNSILRGIRTDCTYDQDHFNTILKDKEIYYSFDLSNATDRMPIALQKKVIGTVLRSRSKADEWAKVLVNWEFHLKTPDRISTVLKYETGQPMGAYSSWPAMALTHHYIVKLAALRAGKPDFWDYALLGDDIVIANASVADGYRKLLRQLDMPISESKTHVSIDTYEFAKRWVWKGIEVTPFSLGGLLESWKRYATLHNFLENQHRHGWVLRDDQHPGLVTSIYSLMGRHQVGARAVKLYMVFKELVKTKQTGVFSGDIVLMASQYFGLPLPELIDDRITLEREALKSVRVKTLERDLETFQSEYALELKRQYVVLKESFPDLDDRSYRIFTRDNTPMGLTLKSKSDRLTELLCRTIWNPDASVEELLPSHEDLMSTFVSGRVFSERSSHVMLHCMARMVKSLLTELKTHSANLGKAVT